MIIVSYDISSNKLRTKFAKFLKRFGHRLQYSVFEIKNSKRVLGIVMAEIENRFENRFSQSDSVMILEFNEHCKKITYGYARNDDDDLIIIG